MWKKINLLFAFAPLCLLNSCGSNISYGNIPERSVNFEVYPSSLDNELNAVGNYKEFPLHGYDGIFVYHLGDMDEEFVAYEQACPLDWEDGCKVVYDSEQGFLVGERCNKKFSTYNGYCRDVSGYGLRKYQIYYFHDSDGFRVTN